ncbi:MAG: 4-(cytidine 5'-diphospho)-2-C-methyl-D-erythritol kinase [Deltaproteobacteria bacterium]|nr:4-(cytidine 5'-diphospho)-2-C-methyl-D-erythritol kinase [Deltaproteobacteria bacterium]
MEKVLARAKVNLTLHVKGKRADGFHEVETAMVPVELADTLEVSDAPEGVVEVFCPAPGVPEGEANLAHKAAVLFFAESGVSGGVRVTIDKRIPAGAGLGGGSSDAACVLNWLNVRYGRPFGPKRLEELSARLGSDVPFFVRGTPALATGRGEILTPLPDPPPRELVIVFPGVSSSTAEAYSRHTLALTSREKVHRLPLSESDPFADLEGMLANDLESAVIAAIPAVGRAKAVLVSAGAGGALMSGSGSSVFGLFTDGETAGKAVRQAVEADASWSVFRTRFFYRGGAPAR